MPIRDAAINALPLGKDVYDDLTYCMQEWQNAGFEAVQGLAEPEEEGSTADWVITLIGNLAWAATVFFPPAFEAGLAWKLMIERDGIVRPVPAPRLPHRNPLLSIVYRQSGSSNWSGHLIA